MRIRAPITCLLLIYALLYTAVGALAATVSVTVPSTVSFSVTDVHVATTGSPNPCQISFADGSLGTGERLQIGVKANAADFTTPGSGLAIAASKVSWTVTGAQNGTGYAGTLSFVDFTTVFQSVADPTSGSVNLVWRLAAPGGGIRAGNHALTLTWKFEAISP